LNNCTISGNSTGGDGGGLFIDDVGGFGTTLTLDNSTVRNNSAVAGGGIANKATLNVDSSRIVNNQATAAGGGIGTTGTGSSATITNSVINSNQVLSSDTAQGGGIFCDNS